MEITLEDSHDKVKSVYDSLKLEEFRKNITGKSTDVEDLVAKSPRNPTTELTHIKANLKLVESLFKDLKFDSIDHEKLQNINLDFICQKKEYTKLTQKHH